MSMLAGSCQELAGIDKLSKNSNDDKFGYRDVMNTVQMLPHDVVTL